MVHLEPINEAVVAVALQHLVKILNHPIKVVMVEQEQHQVLQEVQLLEVEEEVVCHLQLTVNKMVLEELAAVELDQLLELMQLQEQQILAVAAVELVVELVKLVVQV